ncbi:MAG: hypothetical protein ABH873_07925 [Candidatus Firestonebacteria bacterium]
MVKVIKLMIRKSKKGKKYYRYTIPISNELFNEAGFDENDDFKLEAEKGKILVKKGKK